MKCTEKEISLAEALYFQDHGRYITTTPWHLIEEGRRRSYLRLAKRAIRFLREYDPANPPETFRPDLAAKNFSELTDEALK